VLGALLMSIYKGPVIFKSLASKTTPPNSMLPSKLLTGDLLIGLEGWGIDKWTLGGLCLILQSLTVGIETNLKVNVFCDCEMKNYLN
jgi:hypothetical protein